MARIYGPDTAKALQIINDWIAAGDTHADLVFNKLKLTRLPPLPPNLEKLNVTNVHIKEITELPPGIRSIHVCFTSLERICVLPPSLTAVTLNFSKLKVLPAPLPPNLEVLYCVDSQISSIPPLPSTLVGISVHSNNRLKELPALQQCRIVWLNIYNTPIQLVPTLPESLQSIYAEKCPNLMIEMKNPNTIDFYRAQWAELYNRNRFLSKMRILKEDLMAAAWHPRKVWTWIKAGRFVGLSQYGEEEHDYSVLNMMAGYESD